MAEQVGSEMNREMVAKVLTLLIKLWSVAV